MNTRVFLLFPCKNIKSSTVTACLTVWAATYDMKQWTKLATAYEVKQWKLTRTLFRRNLTVDSRCRAGLPVDMNPLIPLVSMSFKFEWGSLWRFVCCCFATVILQLLETLIAAARLAAVECIYCSAGRACPSL